MSDLGFWKTWTSTAGQWPYRTGTMSLHVDIGLPPFCVPRYTSVQKCWHAPLQYCNWSYKCAKSLEPYCAMHSSAFVSNMSFWLCQNVLRLEDRTKKGSFHPWPWPHTIFEKTFVLNSFFKRPFMKIEERFSLMKIEKVPSNFGMHTYLGCFFWGAYFWGAAFKLHTFWVQIEREWYTSLL